MHFDWLIITGNHGQIYKN